MPGEAVHLGAAQHIVSLDDIATRLYNLAGQIDITRN
jgi:hypothetical protein